MGNVSKELLLSALGLEEETEKKFTPFVNDKKLAYIFTDKLEMYSYFLQNNLPEKVVSISNSAILGVLSDGRIVADKMICDTIISIVKEHEIKKKKTPQLMKKISINS